MIVPTEKFSEITQKVRENDGYCPCIIAKTPDSKCICKEFRDAYQALKTGNEVICRCGRFRGYK